MQARVNVSTTAKAPKAVVWGIIDDFENVADYTDAVKVSTRTSEHATGLGASRACDLAPLGSTNETILEYVPSEKMVVSLHDVGGIPVKSSKSTFSLTEIDATTTEITFNAEVQAKGGPFSGIIAKRLEKRLPKGSLAMINDFAAAAEAKVANSDAPAE